MLVKNYAHTDNQNGRHTKIINSWRVITALNLRSKD
jgi:hypothetical protein